MNLLTLHTHFGEDINAVADKSCNEFFDIEMFGITHPNPAYELYVNPHDYYVFEYVLSGSGYIDYANEHIRVEAGDFYFLRKGFVGHYYADRDDPYEKIWINADGRLIEDLANAFGITQWVFVSHNADVTHDIIRRIHSRLEQGEKEPYSELLRCVSNDIFEIFSMVKTEEAIKNTEYQKSLITDMKRYIGAAIFEDITLDKIADHYHLNPSYLIRRFRRSTGITPMRYLSKCRIEAARSMLTFPKRSVKSVAASLRYADAAYFSSCFKEETGYSPTEYTKEVHMRYLGTDKEKNGEKVNNPQV